MKKKNIFFLLIFLFIYSCTSKPKTVLICGDHVCINKKEAEQYFEKNLSIEVKIINNKNQQETDLVNLNLQRSKENKKIISVNTKEKNKNAIKELSKNEINKIKKNIKAANRNKKTIKNTKFDKSKKIKILKKNVDKDKVLVEDVCKIIKKCNIEEISKYLIKSGKKKSFPDITVRQ